MTQQDRLIQKDRMLYTKDKLSANLILVAIVLDALYFVSIYKTDVGTWYYSWLIGASIIYNLLFMLMAFLASEGVKNRRSGYTLLLLILGVMQFVRISYLPAKAHEATVIIQEVEYAVMADGQYAYVLGCLIVSGICCIAAAVTSFINNKTLADYIRSIENQSE